MIDFLKNTEKIVIPEGEVSVISRDNEILWKKEKEKYKIELLYIESTSTGKQFIDTGIIPTITTDYELVGSIVEETSSAIWIAGAPTWIGIHKKGNTIAVTQNSTGQSYQTVNANETFTIGLKGNTAYLNGVKTNTLIRKNATMSLFLFAYHHTNDTGTMNSLIRLYAFKMWDNGILVRDFIPVLDLNNEPCLYDKVTKELFYNQGLQSFNYALQPNTNNPYTVVEYLESTGTQRINTGLFAPLNTDIEVKFSLTSVEPISANNCAIFGGRDASSTSTCVFFFVATSKYFRFDRMSQKYIGNSNTITAEANSVYLFNYKNNVVTLTNLNTNETVSVDIGTPTTFTTSPIQLFAVNTSNSYSSFLKGKIYEWKYLENGKLLQHFIPVLDFKGVACMFDKVSQKLFYNNGSGEFLYGTF